MIKKCIQESVLKIVRLLLINIIVGIVLIGGFFIATKKISITYLVPITMFISIFISIHFIEKRKLKDIGLNFRIKDILFLLSGILTSCTCYIILIAILSLITHQNTFHEYADIIIKGNARNIIGVLTIPLTEELFYRGYVLNDTFGKLKFFKISIISAMMFSIGHWQYVPGTPIINFILVNILSTLLIGLFFNNMVKITKTIWFGTGLHGSITIVH